MDRTQILAALHANITNRLNNGERVVLEKDGLTASEIKQLGFKVKKMGARLITTKFSMAGIQTDTFVESYLKRFSGITVVGDVHGNIETLRKVVRTATENNQYLIFLGDIVDYGAGTIDVLNTVYKIVMDGRGEFIRGNHERKINQWINHPHRRSYVKYSDGNKITLDLICKMRRNQRKRWEGRFTALWNRSRYSLTLRNFVFAHGGVSKGVWLGLAKNKRINDFCMFGEIGEDDDGNKIKTFDWVDDIPEGKIAVVGHTARSLSEAVIVNGKSGGKAVFLDTGSGKGGILTTMQLKFVDDDLQIVSFANYEEKQCDTLLS